MTDDELLARHAAVATMGSEALFAVGVAREVVEDAATQNLVVLGIEGFRLEEVGRRPDLGAILDLSDGLRHPWLQAVALGRAHALDFLASQPSELVFSFVIAHEDERWASSLANGSISSRDEATGAPIGAVPSPAEKVSARAETFSAGDETFSAGHKTVSADDETVSADDEIVSARAEDASSARGNVESYDWNVEQFRKTERQGPPGARRIGQRDPVGEVRGLWDR